MRLKEIEERLAAIKNELTTRAAELKEEEITALENEVTRMYITAHSTYGASLSVKSADRQKRRREVMKKQSGIFLQARA